MLSPFILFYFCHKDQHGEEESKKVASSIDLGFVVYGSRLHRSSASSIGRRAAAVYVKSLWYVCAYFRGRFPHL